MSDTTAALVIRLRERHVNHHGDGFEPPYINRDGAEAADLIEALAAQPSAGAQDIGWVWTKKGSDTDGDPIIFDGTFGDYRSRVVLSRTDRSWSAIVNNGHGKSDMPSEHAAMAYAEETAAKLLRSRLEKARECLALYATPAQPDTGDVAALRERVALIIRQSGIDRGWAQPGDAETLATRILAALSKPSEDWREGPEANRLRR